MTSSTDKRPFKCDLIVEGKSCGASFSTTRDLTRHRRTKSHAAHVGPVPPASGSVANARCLIHERDFGARGDALRRHLMSGQHEESELQQFYADYAQSGEWVGDSDGLYTAVKDLMIQLGSQ